MIVTSFKIIIQYFRCNVNSYIKNIPDIKNTNRKTYEKGYEYELGKIEDNINEARFVNTNAKINLKGVKDENRGNFKSNLKIGFETGNFNFSLSGGYNTKDKNSQIGIGIGVSF